MVNAFIRDIPEELIREFLSYVLYRDRASFDSAAFAMPRTFTRNPPKRQDVDASTLLVCKQWHRIGMPLLYESVFISNMAQLKTLAATLQERPDIGPKIRRLRLKDAFGRDLPAVLSLTPNIHTLSVCTKISSRTSITGLRALLKTSVVNIAPTRLMIEPPFHWRRSSVVQENMAECLIALVSNWPDVVS